MGGRFSTEERGVRLQGRRSRRQGTPGHEEEPDHERIHPLRPMPRSGAEL